MSLQPDPRAPLIAEFLAQSGWGDARQTPLAGDASDRRYWRLQGPQGPAVLMDNPPGGADDPAAFLRVARHLTALGLSAPAILAEDAARGLILLEDLGDALYPAHLATAPQDEPALYLAATGVLARLQAHPPLPGIPDLSPAAWAATATEAMAWYGAPDPSAIGAALADALGAHSGKVMILRDYHAENLIWLPARHGPARVGLLDFQGAQTGAPAYDLISLLQDARRDVAAETQDACLRHFCDLTGRSDTSLRAEAAAVGALRALRILGVFRRLAARGKPQYLAHLPRVWRDLQANLAHAALAPLARACAGLAAP